MADTPRIYISEPCHEDWAKMTTADKGRFCNSCFKTVVDFTAMSNDEIMQYFRESAGQKVCGRFKSNQVHVPLPVKHNKPSAFQAFFGYPFRKIAAVLITSLTLLTSACKPTTTGQVCIDPNDVQAKKDTAGTGQVCNPGDKQAGQAEKIVKPAPKSTIDNQTIGEPELIGNTFAMPPDEPGK